ncbi:PaaI family thioesterase (plasmid) [Streptomyces sp. BI20]|uniref:PaaI family thioesterase n=1 Tax=Streptomyces sp. BI20 TaxID=3403460 RepID=UPI003C7221DE
MSTDPLEHYPGCYGCGTANERGLGLRLTWDEEHGTARYTVPAHAEGAPGIAHGGHLAALVDEAMALIGTAAWDGPTMTARLEVRYLRPTPVGEPLFLRGRVEERTGRVLRTLVEGGVADGPVTFRASGTLIGVPADRWLAPLAAVYRPAEIGAGIVLGLELLDASPSRWTIRATPEGITGDRGSADAADTADVVYRGPAGPWHDLSRHRRDLDEVLAEDGVRISGDTTALRRLLAALAFDPPETTT